MPSTSEKGHAKNVANLSKLIEVCKGLGSKYNPSKELLKIANLEAKLAECTANLQEHKDKDQAESVARNNRIAAFNNNKKLSTRLIAAIKTSEATEKTIEDALSINKKIQGERITAKPADTKPTEGTTTPTNNSISTSQLSYTNIIDHYKKYHTLITSMGKDYSPNEEELKLVSLTTYINNLETLTKAVDTAETATKNAQIKRDKSFYADKTGIPDISAGVKEYIKSVFGSGSPEHKMVTKITFSKPTS